MIKFIISDGHGKGSKTKVTKDGHLSIATRDKELPPQGTSSQFRFFSGLLGTTGLDSGSTDMNVDGSVTPQIFKVTADPDFDIRIMKILITLQDTKVEMQKFGNQAALTNGFDIIVTEDAEDTDIIKDAKVISEIIIQSMIESPYGGGKDLYIIKDINAAKEDILALPMTVAMMVPGGIRLGIGTKDELRAVVNDDLTAILEMTVRVAGHKHFEVEGNE